MVEGTPETWCQLDTAGVKKQGRAMKSYKVEELAREAGTSVRTVRYYLRRGLLPTPPFRGKDTGYGREHLVRLRAIRKLQEAFLPLDAISLELSSRSLAELEQIADGKLAVSGSEEPSPRAVTPKGGTKARGRSAEEHAAGMRAFTRVELAPGIELVVDEAAPPESLRLVAQILAEVKASSSSREGR